MTRRARAGAIRVALLGLVTGLLGGGARATEGAILVRAIGGAPAATAALLARGGEGGPLRAAAAAYPLAYAPDRIELLLLLEIDGASLLQGHPGGQLGLEIHAYAVAPGGRIAAARSEGVAIDLVRAGEGVERSGIRWLAPLVLAPGDYAIRLHARERRTGSFVLREQRIVLPSPGSGSAPFLAAAARGGEAWVDARSPDLAALAGFETLAALLPTALPVLPAGGRARIDVWSGGGDLPPLRATLADGRGAEVAELALEPAGGVRAGTGVEVASYLVDFPDRTGLHDLRLRGAGGEGYALPRRVVLRPADEGLPWNRLGRVDVVAARAERSVAPSPGLVAPEDRRRYAGAVRTAWARYAAGERIGAVASHQAFEGAALDADRRRGMGWLQQSELPLIERVSAAGGEALLPLALFYRDLFAAHLELGRLGLARRAEGVCANLLSELARRASTPAERELAAAALESLAGEMLEVGAPVRAAGLLARSAELLPARPDTWVALATLLEADGRLDRAGDALDRALALDPRHREARLRRARIVGRAGAPGRSASELDRLLAEPIADWVGVVAAQERARMLFAAGAHAAAADLLEPLVERWPEEPSLWAALAFAAERSERRESSRHAAERATQADRAFARAPRRIYAEPPEAQLARGRSAVEAAALLRLEALGAALAGDDSAE